MQRRTRLAAALLAVLLVDRAYDATPRLLLACFLLLASRGITGADRQR